MDAYDFVSVGAFGNQTISGSIQGTNSVIRTGSNVGFFLSDTDVLQPLRVSFNYIYRGTGDTTTTPPDFKLQIIRFLDPGVSQSTNGIRTALNITAPLAGVGTTNTTTGFGSGTVYAFDYRQTAAFGDVSLAGLASGFYGISISLTESTSSESGLDNQAAGFNEFTVQTIPFDFEPSLGVGLLGLGFGLNKVRKNMKAKKNTEV